MFILYYWRLISKELSDRNPNLRRDCRWTERVVTKSLSGGPSKHTNSRLTKRIDGRDDGSN